MTAASVKRLQFHCSLSHHAEREDAVLERGDGFQEHQARRRQGTMCSAHVRDPKDGEGKVDEGNTAKPKIFHEDTLATTLMHTAKQSCEPQARRAAAAVDHFDVEALQYREATE